MKKLAIFLRKTIWNMAFLSFLAVQVCHGDEYGPDDETYLMFYGENLEVLTIASGREEGAWQAPAVANVIPRTKLLETGADTLGKALQTVPGFYMAKKERGTMPYLRGIPNSTLFLYDTLPICSDTSKSVHPIDYDLSLAPVKRIEIIRGTGSVLWGPDAFAGIVNVVPLTGKDIHGIETGVSYGMPGDQTSAFVNMGHDGGIWAAFLSVSGRYGEEDDTRCNIVQFWQADDPEQRFGETEPGTSHYLDMTGNFSYSDWFTISGRLSENEKPFAINYEKENLSWQESRKEPLGQLRFEIKKELDRVSAVRVTGAYTSLSSEYKVIDRTYEQKEDSLFGEAIWDKSIFTGSGLVTCGISYRRKKIENAPIWNAYLPDYIVMENEQFWPSFQDLLPDFREKDYRTELFSFFGQYNHMIGDKINVWIGVRDDEHDKYKDHVSYNAGASWTPTSSWIVKTLFGTAYRTPFAKQLLEDETPDLEKIRNLSLQIAWEPDWRFGAAICGFHNRIEQHIKEDPYAGLSQPNRQTIGGIEIEWHYSPFKKLDFKANLTFIDNNGPDETYRKKEEWIYYGESPIDVLRFIDLEYPYDPGPDSICNLMSTWRPSNRLTSFIKAKYVSSRQLVYFEDDLVHINTVDSNVWLFDAGVTIKDIFFPDTDLEITVENLGNTDYEVPGTYGAIKGDPISAQIMLRRMW